MHASLQGSQQIAGPLPQVAWVPGSFELPVLAAAMAKSGKYDAVITVGAVVSCTFLDHQTCLKLHPT
jgi:6,7-dimethyl-8-ribityllumazine synthase